MPAASEGNAPHPSVRRRSSSPYPGARSRRAAAARADSAATVASPSDVPTAKQTARTLLRPRWIAAHLFVWAAAVAMVQLGRWQLRVSNSKHFDLQNFSYTVQWWAFAACALVFWLKAMRNVHRPPRPPAGGAAVVVRSGPGGQLERVRRPGPGTASGPADLMTPTEAGAAPVVFRGYVAPSSSVAPHRSDGDSHHASYNDYLWQLALADSAASTALGRAPADPRPLGAAPGIVGSAGARPIDGPVGDDSGLPPR